MIDNGAQIVIAAVDMDSVAYQITYVSLDICSLLAMSSAAGEYKCQSLGASSLNTDCSGRSKYAL
jgi:hypothetical protein